MLRAATARDLAAVEQMLEQAGLPRAGLRDHAQHLAVAESGGRIVGAVAYERYGDRALLRSLVVAPGQRGVGLGGRLVRHGLEQMQADGVCCAYGLTTTIPDWLARTGWTELAQAALPEALHASAELRGACPASARAFCIRLAPAAA